LPCALRNVYLISRSPLRLTLTRDGLGNVDLGAARWLCDADLIRDS